MVAVGAEGLAPGGAAGAGCAQTGAEIASAATAVPINRCFMVSSSLSPEVGDFTAAYAAVPLMLFVRITLLMIRFRSFNRFFLIFSVVPMGPIEVVAAILVSIAARLKECGTEGRSILGAADRFRLSSGDNSRASDHYRQRE